MNFLRFSYRRVMAASALALCVSAASYAQVNIRPSTSATPPRQIPLITAPPRQFNVAEGNNLYCAGFVQSSPIDTSRSIVGAVNEQDGYLYAEKNFLYINAGANKGVQVGDVMSVVRPRGQVETKWSNKDHLGFYVQEVGAVEVVRVKSDVSVVRVKTSCDNLLLGDLVQPSTVRASPAARQRPMLDLFADPTGKKMGRLFMARNGAEMVSRDNIVYIDLGAEDNVQVGDYLTIFRPLGKGNLKITQGGETADARSGGYESDNYRGGKFSNQTARKTGSEARDHVITTHEAKKDRPAALRKIVGEMVILNVKEKTATAMITQTAQEIHTGDWVEVQ